MSETKKQSIVPINSESLACVTNTQKLTKRQKKQNKWNFGQLIKQYGDKIDSKTKTTYKTLLVSKLWKEAVKGDKLAIKIILERTDGLPTQAQTSTQNNVMVSFISQKSDNTTPKTIQE